MLPPPVRSPLHPRRKDDRPHVDGTDARTRRGSGIHDPPGPAPRARPERRRPAASRSLCARLRRPALPPLGRARARRRARRGGARGSRRGRRLVGRVHRLRRAPRRRPHRGSHEPRLLRPLDEAAAQLDARRAGRRGDRRVRLAAVDRPSFHRTPARAPDRGRYRPAQLRRGTRHRPGGRGRRDQPRARTDHRLRPAQRDGGLRHRRPHVRRQRAAELGASSGFSA